MSLSQETVGIDGSGQHGSNLPHIRVRLDGGGQHHHVRLFQDLLVFQQIDALHQQASVALGGDLAHLTLYVVDAVILHRPAVEFVKILTGRPDVDIEHRHVGIRVLVPDEHGVLGGVHAADF